MAKKTTTLASLKPDQRNANKHSEYGTRLLEQSIKKSGLGRSIVISKQGTIIAGNGVAEAAGAMGIEDVEIIDSDGSKIIAVRRTDIDDNSEEFFRLALADNIVAKANIVMDATVTDAIVSEYNIDEFKPTTPKPMGDIASGGYFDRQANPANPTTPNEDDDDIEAEGDNQKKVYKEAKYPLSIVLSRSEMQGWDKIKMNENLSDDTTVFLRLVDFWKEKE